MIVGKRYFVILKMRSMICRSAELVFCSKFNEYITKTWYEESKKMFHCHNLFKDGFVAFSVSNCYLSICSPIDYWTPRNKRQFNSNKILRCHLIFFSNAVWDISAIVTPQCIKSCHPPGSVNRIHDDVIKWNHFCITCPLWEESTGHWWIPSQIQWCGALMFSLICAWTKETPEILDAIPPIITSLYCSKNSGGTGKHVIFPYASFTKD